MKSGSGTELLGSEEKSAESYLSINSHKSHKTQMKSGTAVRRYWSCNKTEQNGQLLQ